MWLVFFIIATIMVQGCSELEVDGNAASYTSKEPKDGYNAFTNRMFAIGYYKFPIPEYYDVKAKQSRKLEAYAENGDKIASLSISRVPDDSKVSYERLDNNSEFYTLINDVLEKIEVEDISDEWHETDLVKGKLVSFNYNTPIVGTGKLFIFPSFEDNAWYVITSAETDNTDYSYYDDFIAILGGITFFEAGTIDDTMEAEVSFPLKDAQKAAIVATINLYEYMDYATNGKSLEQEDVLAWSKAIQEFNPYEWGDGIGIDENTWKVYGIQLKSLYMTEGEYHYIDDIECYVTYQDGTYIISDIHGYYHSPAMESFSKSMGVKYTGVYIHNLENKEYALVILNLPESMIRR